MKKIILFLAIIFSGIYLINFISAISVNLNSGDILDSGTWGKISSVTDKISVEGGDMKINGKIYISGDLCDNSGKCLGKCEADEYWDSASISCKTLNCSSQIIDDYDIGAINNGNNLAVNKTVSITSGDTTYTQTFACNMGELSKSGGETSAITCDSGYIKEGNACKADWVKVVTTANSARCPTMGPPPSNLAVCNFYWEGVYLFSKQIQGSDVGVPNGWFPYSTSYTYSHGGYYYAISRNCNSCGAIGGNVCSYALARKPM